MVGLGEGDGFGLLDQAAGLRRWAEQQGASDEQVSAAPSQEMAKACPTLIVVGLPPGPDRLRLERARQTLQRWQANGHTWLGDAARWRLVALDVDSPYLHTLAYQQPRWALWVEGDPDSFRRTYLCLRRLREGGGPTRLLVLHPGFASHAGLLDNLRQAASAFFDIELLLLSERLGEKA